jgi:hypothetical protein
MKTVTFFTLNNELKCVNKLNEQRIIWASSMLTTKISEEVYDIIFFWQINEAETMKKNEFYSKKRLFK